ncbi:MAG: hypothetical protein IKO32_12010 [Lachnospiraceae bacterium]|nr:hypothetical protein [Lachnospiraceae bacterium]
MNKNNPRKTNNKGIALVSIIIAIAFISIIGVALLSITYTNFQMKVLNIQSKENFYETDGVLMDVVASLRNKVDSPTSVVINDEGKYNISSCVDSALNSYMTKVSGEADDNEWVYKDNATGDYFYITTKLNATQTSSTDLDIFNLNGLQVKQVSKESGREGYQNTVRTNMELHVRSITSAGNSRKGVGEFSFLLDGPIVVDSDQLPFVTMYGDCFFSSYDYSAGFKEYPAGAGNSYTCPGDSSNPAIYLLGETKMNIVGENNNCVVYGDIVLDDDSCLYIPSGKLTVYGNIYLNGHSALITEADIYMPSDYLPGRTDYCGIFVESGTKVEDHFYSSKIDFGTSTDYRVTDGTNIHPLTTKNVQDFCDLLKLNDADATNDGITPQILRDDLPYQKSGEEKKTYKLYELPALKDGQGANLSNKDTLGETTYYGKPALVQFAADGNSGSIVVNGNTLKDALVFSLAQPGEPEVGSGGESDTPVPTHTISNVPDWAISQFTNYMTNNVHMISAGQSANIKSKVKEDGPDPYNPTWTVTYTVSEGGSGGGGAAGKTTIVDNNVNSTIISAAPVHVNVNHGIYVSKLGSDLYNFLTETPAGKDGKDYPYYDSSVHNFGFSFGGYENQLKPSNEEGYSASSFVVSDANSLVQSMMNVSIGGEGGSKTYINSVHFKNYVKDAN